MICFVAGRKAISCMALAVGAMIVGAPVAAQPVSQPSADDTVYKSSRHRNKWPRASLQAQARTQVDHDTVTITLAVEITDTSQNTVAQTLNSTVKTAMERALENADSIKVSSGNYRVWPMNDQDGTISNWRGRSEILLESTDFAAASQLAATLNDLMAVSSVNFSVSPQLRAAEEQRLLGQAAQAFRTRAQALADALGFAGYTLRSIDVGGSGAQYEMAPRGMAAQAAMFKAADSIPLEGGTETVSVSIHGSVFLLDEIK